MRWLIVAGFGLSLLMRGAFLTADPPAEKISGISWSDEARWAHNARNKVLFDAWRADHYNDALFSAPSFTAASYLSFLTLGVGTWQARVPSVAAGMGLVACLYALLNRRYGMRAGLIGLVLAGTDYMLVMYSRAALIEMLCVSLMVLAAYGFARGRESAAFAVASGGAAAAVGITKALWFGFAVVPLATSLVLLLQHRDDEERRLERRRLARYLSGLLLVMTPWLLVWLYPHWEEIARLHLYHARLYAPPSGAWGYLVQVVVFPFAHPVFARALPVTVVGLLAARTILSAQAERTPAESEPAMFFMIWLVVGATIIMAFDLYDQRRYVMLLPPLIGLAAIGLTQGRRPESAETSRRVGGGPFRRWVSGGLALYGLYWICGAVLRAGAGDLDAAGLHFRHLAAGAGGAALLVWMIAGRLPQQLKDWQGGLSRPAVVIVVVTVTLGANLWQYGRWATTRSYTVYDTSRSLADLVPPKAYVLGDAALSLTLENRMRPLYVHEWFGLLGGAETSTGAEGMREPIAFRSDGIPIDPRQRAEARFILVHANAYEEPDRELHRLLAQARPGPPVRDFALYDGFRPGVLQRVLLLERRMDGPPP